MNRADRVLFGYELANPGLLKLAFIHTSYANETGAKENNERLEFLGDAVLELIVSEYLYENMFDAPEGELARVRAAVVCEPALARWARDLGIGKFLLLGVGEEKSGGRDRDSILSDTLEAVLGAHYLSEGFEKTRSFVLDSLEDNVTQALRNGYVDPKTRLQELLQAGGGSSPTYKVIKEAGPDHAKVFTVEVAWDNQIKGSGKGRSKKEAQQKAAAHALERFQGAK